MNTPKLSPGFMQGILAVVLVGGFFGVLLIVISKPDMRDAMLIMVGNLSGALMAVVGFYYGSSKSSAQKNELLANSTPRATGDTVTMQQTTATVTSTEAKDADA